MSSGIYLKEDPEVDTNQLGFDFEFLNEDGSVTNQDVNLVDLITNAASTLIIGAGNGLYVVSGGNTISSTWSWSEPGPDPVYTRLDKIESVLRKIQDRLAVVEDVGDVEMKKALRKAYDKYRMVEDMIERKNNNES
jgi:hypothetical protein